MEYFICTQTGYIRAMNFYHRIPYRGKHLWAELSPELNRIPPGPLTSHGQMKFIIRLMETLIYITVTSRWRLIHVCTLRTYCNPKSDSVLWVHKFVHHEALLLWNAVPSKCVENGYDEYATLFNAYVRENHTMFAWKRCGIYHHVYPRWSN